MKKLLVLLLLLGVAAVILWGVLRKGEPPLYRLADSIGPPPALAELSSGCPLIETLRDQPTLAPAPTDAGPASSGCTSCLLPTSKRGCRAPGLGGAPSVGRHAAGVIQRLGNVGLGVCSDVPLDQLG